MTKPEAENALTRRMYESMRRVAEAYDEGSRNPSSIIGAGVILDAAGEMSREFAAIRAELEA